MTSSAIITDVEIILADAASFIAMGLTRTALHKLNSLPADLPPEARHLADELWARARGPQPATIFQ